MKLLVQPGDGIAPLLAGIKHAKKTIDILIFRMDYKEIETALKAAASDGVAVRALIAHTNKGGEPKLRSLEMRFLEAGITVARTAGDLIRYHGKMMITDSRTLFLLSFNFVHLDIDHSRGFGIVTHSGKLVREAVKLFEADLNRHPYTADLNSLIVSPSNAREELTSFIKEARKQLLIYDPQIGDRQVMRLLENRAKAGLEVRIIGAAVAHSTNLLVTPLTTMRLHTRTIIRDGREAFIGSQSLRQPELDSRREIGMIVRDSSVVKTLLATFEKDWGSTGFDEAREEARKEALKNGGAGVPLETTAKATRALVKVMPPVKAALKKAIKRAVSKAGKDAVVHGDLKLAVKDAVKKASSEAVTEIVMKELQSEAR